MGAYDRLAAPRGARTIRDDPTTFDDGLPPAWELPDAGPPVLLPEDFQERGEGGEKRRSALLSSALYRGAAGTNRRVTSADPIIAGSLADGARFGADPAAVERLLLAGRGGEGNVVIPAATFIPDHEPLRS